MVDHRLSLHFITMLSTFFIRSNNFGWTRCLKMIYSCVYCIISKVRLVFHVTVFKLASFVSSCNILWLTQTEVTCCIHLTDYVIAKSQETFKQGAVSTLWTLPDDWEIKTGEGTNLRLLSLILNPVLFFESPTGIK